MLGAVNYLHSMDICHRDLKLENFIFTEKGPAGEIKMIDFGFSKHYLSKEHMHEVVGTSYYIAPEVLAKDYTSKSDMWSLGVIFYMMLCGRVPFGGNNDWEIQENVRRGEFKMTGKYWRGVSTTAKAFVRSLLDMDVDMRPSAGQALKHPWITSGGTDEHEGESTAVQSSDSDVGVDALETTVANLREYRTFSRIKKTALMAVAVGLNDRDVDAMKRAFEELDTMKNGTISLAEFRGVMKKTQFVDESEVDKLFNDLDLDHTGMIKYTEFLAAAVQENLYLEEDRVVDAFHKLDTDSSGSITRENLKTVLGGELDDAAIDRMIATADFAKDGVISLDEFRRMMAGETAT
jgi:calcium-dependent protein kinase